MPADHCRILRIVLIITIISSWTTIISESDLRVPSILLRNLDTFRNVPISYQLYGPLTEITRSRKRRDATESKIRFRNTKYRVLRWADHERDVPTEGGAHSVTPPPKSPPGPPPAGPPAAVVTKPTPDPKKNKMAGLK